MNNKIDKIEAEEILDSRGNPTLKVTVYSGVKSGTFSVPSGASTGAHEAHELRDSDGHMTQAIKNIENIIAPALLGKDVTAQKDIDETMLKLDGTENKTNLGANTLLGISVAVAKLAAEISELPVFSYLREMSRVEDERTVPYLYMNLLNGGKHAKNGLAFQEYHIVPDTEDVAEAIHIGIKVQNALSEIVEREINEDSLITGDEGGLAPKVTDIRKPLLWLREAIDHVNTTVNIHLALDVAASSFYVDGRYVVDGKDLTAEDLIDLYTDLIKEFNIFSIEDPFYEEDFKHFRDLREKFPGLHIVGDDLTVTNQTRLAEAVKENSVNTMIVKLNQIGTLSETISTMEYAIKNNVNLIVSHRSGETMDDFIADLACAFHAFGLKAGSPMAKERRIKYDRLVKIT